MPLSEVIHAYALGPSVLIINPLKNIYENANTYICTWWCTLGGVSTFAKEEKKEKK